MAETLDYSSLLSTMSSLNLQFKVMRSMENVISLEDDLRQIKSYKKEVEEISVSFSSIQSAAQRTSAALQSASPAEASTDDDAPKQSSDLLDAINIETNPYKLVGSLINRGMEADAQKVNILAQVKGDVDKAKMLYQQLSDYSINAPYDKASLIEAQGAMLKLGLSSDTAFSKLKNIGDIALGNSSNMQTLSEAFAEATKNGSLQTQEYEKMKAAGFDPLEAISKKTGETMDSLMQRLKEGAVSSAELSKAFEWATESGGQFYQGADKAANSLGGSWNNMLKSISELVLKVYELISPIISPIISVVSYVFNLLNEGLGWFINKLQEGNPIVTMIAIAIGALAAALLVYRLYTEWATIAQMKLSLALLSNPIVLIIAAIVALVGWLVYLISSTEGWGEAWKHTVNGAKLLWQAFIADGELMFNRLVNGFMVGLNMIKVAWYEFKNLLGLGNENENNAALEKINADTQNRIETIRQGERKVLELYEKSDDEFAEAAGSLKFNSKKKTEESNSSFWPTATGKENASPNTKNTANNPLKSTTDSISTGGAKGTNITINLGKMQDQIVINTVNAGEGATKIRQILEEELNRLLGSVAAMQAT